MLFSKFNKICIAFNYFCLNSFTLNHAQHCAKGGHLTTRTLLLKLGLWFRDKPNKTDRRHLLPFVIPNKTSIWKCYYNSNSCHYAFVFGNRS